MSNKKSYLISVGLILGGVILIFLGDRFWKPLIIAGIILAVAGLFIIEEAIW